MFSFLFIFSFYSFIFSIFSFFELFFFLDFFSIFFIFPFFFIFTSPGPRVRERKKERKEGKKERKKERKERKKEKRKEKKRKRKEKKRKKERSRRVCRRAGCHALAPAGCGLQFCHAHCSSQRCRTHGRRVRVLDRTCRFWERWSQCLWQLFKWVS